MALLPSSSYLADERGYDNYGAGAMAGAQSSLPFASPAARTFTDQLSGYSAPPPRTAVPPVPHTLHHLNSIRENAGRPSLAPPTAPSPDILSPISAPREYPSFISEALANPNYGLNGENGLETGYGGNGGALSAQPGQQPGQPGQPRTTNAPRPAYTVPLAPPSVTDTDTESLASVHPDWTKAEDPVAAFSQTMAARVTKNTSSRAQLILASFCLDIIALGFIVSSISGTVTWNKTLTWVTYSSATIDGRNGTDIYTGIWGQCTYPLNPTPAFPNKCLMWFDDPWAQNTFGKPYVFAMPILTMVSLAPLWPIPNSE